MAQEGLESKREQLAELEKSEREAKRLEEALGRGSLSASRIQSPDGEQPREEGEEQAQSPTQSQLADEQSSYLPPHPGPNPVRRRAPGMGLLSALSYTLHGMMDVDPETARRNSISKTRELISQACLHLLYDLE
jgi:sorting nexin-41/42